MKKIICAALLSAAVATPALAQDNPAFTGPRVEGLVGYDRVPISGFKDPDGVMYGVGIGYDFATSGALFGIEAEASDATTQVKIAGPNLEAKRDLYVGARVGTVIGGANLLYLKAGYTNARFGLNGLGSANADGFRVGAGVERAVSENTFVKAEYRYSNYEDGGERHQLVGGFGFRF